MSPWSSTGRPPSASDRREVSLRHPIAERDGRQSPARATPTAVIELVVLAALFAVLAVLSQLLPIHYVFLGSELLIAILFASSLNLLMGYGGMLSFGHAAYYALAAYTSALLLVRLSWPF